MTSTAFGHDYWRQLFGAAHPLILIVRGELTSVSPKPDRRQLVAGPDVEVVALPPLRPGTRLATEIPRALWALRRLEPEVPVVLRVPGIVSSVVLAVLLGRRRPFAVQVVGDALDVAFAAGIGGRWATTVGMALGGTASLACRRADVVAYVTDSYLQRRYPAGKNARVHSFSNVQLDTRAVPNAATSKSTVIRVLTVASLEQPYKRVDLLIEAVSVLREQGWPLRLDVVGEGALLGQLIALATQRGLDEAVCFHGWLDRVVLGELYRRSDLFVLCSDTEGMPRALIEAAASGLPCVATHVGGIPEVLAPDSLCRSGSLASVVGALRRHLVSPTLRRRNVARAGAVTARFLPEALDPRRAEFVADVLRLTKGGAR